MIPYGPEAEEVFEILRKYAPSVRIDQLKWTKKGLKMLNIKYKCPSPKRRICRIGEAGLEDYHVIIANELIDHTKWDYVSPHHYWEYLHEECKGDWRPSTACEYCYLLPGRPWAATAVLFEKATDATKFMLRFNGTPLSAVLEDHASEVETYERLKGMLRMSRLQRQSAYPGLDQLIQSARCVS